MWRNAFVKGKMLLECGLKDSYRLLMHKNEDRRIISHQHPRWRRMAPCAYSGIFNFSVERGSFDGHTELRHSPGADGQGEWPSTIHWGMPERKKLLSGKRKKMKKLTWAVTSFHWRCRLAGLRSAPKHMHDAYGIIALHHLGYHGLGSQTCARTPHLAAGARGGPAGGVGTFFALGNEKRLHTAVGWQTAKSARANPEHRSARLTADARGNRVHQMALNSRDASDVIQEMKIMIPIAMENKGEDRGRIFLSNLPS